MALTYLATSMIETPTVFPQLSVTSLNVNTITSSPSVLGNLTIFGSLTALSGFNVVIASTTTTSALSISNIQITPALQVTQGPAGQVIALFRNQAGNIVSIRDTGLTVNGIVSASNAGSSNLWHSVYTTTLANSANWSNVYTTVVGNSSVFTNVQSSSANWNNTYTNVRSNSANWQSVYSSVNTLSTTWEESADILPTVTNYLSTNNVLVSSVTLNGSFIGSTSATTINIGGLSARTFDLVHLPANDSVDPILNIGETGTEGFSGFRVRYEEASGRLMFSSRTGSTILTSAIINTVTGQVGVSCLPNQALTVGGNISATGDIFARNITQYMFLSAAEPLTNLLQPTVTDPISGYFLPQRALTLPPSGSYKIKYDLFFTKTEAGGFMVFALSGSNTFLTRGITINFPTSFNNLTATSIVNLSGTIGSVGLVNVPSSNLITFPAVPSPNVPYIRDFTYNTKIEGIITTELNPCTLILGVSTSALSGSFMPRAGSCREVTRIA